MKPDHRFPFLSSSIYCILILFLSSCFSTLPVEFKKIDQLSISSGENKAAVNFNLLLKNPNNWGFRIITVETEMLIDRHSLGNVILPKNFRIKGKSEAGIPIQITTTTQDLLAVLPGSLATLFGSQSMDAVVKGNITFGKFIFRKKYPFELKQKVDRKLIMGVLGN
ncbi:MAG TPA: hypothetical protein PLU53_13080 [Bacteroidia bacterium]|nr:hypothetical protein [Bacteroidia bacterium]